ncbi:hypothetical protein [Phenylobacterium montanum]|uniref:Uncharacterized protein n=1 Tax=Phenylobacterium montanum TaxID=2823693 RepID=A0A975G3P5_9CAUL|nr:hypothetical protein [Caulobacter sp. S6]QUD90096.1 hypothetical protein KCG34_09620 [Caulobacter sp. S6]
MHRQDQAPWDREGSTPRRRSAGHRRAVGVVFSLVGHVVVLMALMIAPRMPPQTPEPTPLTVALIDGRALAPAPIPAPEPAKAPQPTHERAKPKPVKASHRPEPVKPLTRHVTVARAEDPAAARAARIAAEDAPVATSVPTLSAAQLAGAASADSGELGGGTCDMAGRLQEVLRHDHLVRTAVSSLTGKSIMVWNGEWKWMPGDTGQGLTAVRQALIWEIAYAPESCRSRQMHGLVLFSVNEAGGPVRLAVGDSDWRWTDLLAPRGAARTYRP